LKTNPSSSRLRRGFGLDRVLWLFGARICATPRAIDAVANRKRTGS
jgi:hypothetical protein